MSDAEKLYQTIIKSINRGHDVEIRKGSDGKLMVFEIKKNKVT